MGGTYTTRPFFNGAGYAPVCRCVFTLIAVLFILFDIEVVFFLPWAIVFRESSKRDLGIHSRRDDRLYCYLTGRLRVCVKKEPWNGNRTKTGNMGVVTTTLEQVVNWSRTRAMCRCCWFGVLCHRNDVGPGPDYDMSRFGMELMRASPRQSDL